MKTFQMTALAGRRSNAAAQTGRPNRDTSEPPLRPLAILAMLALGATLALPAHAALINFELTGSRQASFQIDASHALDTSSASVFGDQIK